MTRRDWLILLAVMLLAAVLRFYQLGVTPPGPQFDEAFNAIDAEQIMAGNRPLFLPANGGREVFYSYLQAAVGALWGLNLYTLRLVSVIAGVLTVGALYILVRLLFRRHSQLLATMSALALTINYWHVHFSHYGIRVILMPLFLSGIFGFFWFGMEARSRRMRLIALVIAGALAGLSVWVNPTGRFVPFVVVAYALWLFWRHPERRKFHWDGPIGGTLIFGAVAFLVFLPLGLEFYRHPEFFFGHASEVSVFASRVTGDASPWELLGVNVLRVLGMFSFDGDLEWAHGIANRPVFDWFMAIPFYIGFVWWTLRLFGKGTSQPDPDRDSLVLFALWAVVMMAPSVLSEAAPNYSRTLPAVPTVALAAGLGLTWIVTLPRLQPWWGPAIAGVALTASLVVTVYDYFVRFPSFPEVYYVFDADKVDALQWMHEQVDNGATVYLSPLWSTHATVTFLRDNDIESLDSREAIVLPAPGRSAVYAFPAEQQGDARRIADLWDVEVEMVNDRYGNPLLATVQLTPEQATQWPPAITPDSALSARFDDAPTLLGVRVSEDQRDLWLYWREEQPTYRDLTSFVHLLDERNQRVGQSDRAPGDGTYLTPWWSTGERVAQRYTPEITDICAGGEPVRIVTGWYEYAADNARRPRLDAPGDIALAGAYTLPFTSVPADQATPPAALSVPISGALALTGYGVNGLPTTVTEGGAPLTLDLYFVGDEASASTDLTVDLVPAAMTAAAGQSLWSGPLAPAADWQPGEVLCRRLHLRVPPPSSILPGDYLLRLTVGGVQTPVAPLRVTPSTRQFSIPVMPEDDENDAFKPAAVVLGDQIRLAGFEVVPMGDQTGVTFLWQALVAPVVDAKVFVHIVDATGNIVAQSDAIPAGYHTNQWVTGEYVLNTHQLEIPTGAYQLRVGMYDPVTMTRLPAIDDRGARYPDDAITLGEITVP